MKFPPLTIRNLSIMIGILLVVLAVAWWGLWTLAAAQYRHVIDGWIESGRAAGYNITYDSRRLFGFPRHVVFRFANVQWKNTDNIEFHADDIDIAATPWQWQNFDAKFKNRVQITAPIEDGGPAMILGGEDGRAHVELDKDGIWKFSRISLAAARLGRAPDYLFLADRLQASATRPDTPPKDHTETGLSLSGEADGVTLPAAMVSPFGQAMAKCALELQVMGGVPDFRKRDSVEAWNKGMNVVAFDSLSMEWGPLTFASKGAMGFDDDLQPEGAFAGVIGGQEKVLDALMEHGFIAKRQEAMLNSALSLFARPSHAGDVEGIEVPITVQLGGLFLGPVKIFSFPEIEWPKSTPAAPTAQQPN